MAYKDPEAKRAYDKAYRLSNKTKIQAQRQTTMEARRAYMRAWRDRHAVHVAAYDATYKAANRERRLAMHKTYYHRTKHLKKAAILAYQAAYYRLHRPRILARVQAYEIKHRCAILTYHRTYYAAHRGEAAVKGRLYRQTHPEVGRAADASRRARLKQAPSDTLSAAQWEEIQVAFDHRCAYCGTRCPGQLTRDHITPVGPDGAHSLHNIVPACVSCNAKKQTGPPIKPVQPLLLTIAPPKKKQRTT